MSTLTLSASTNFSGQALVLVDQVNFTNLDARLLVQATFAASQFNDVQILDTVSFNGSAGRNGIVVNGGQVSGFTWTFNNWSSSDSIVFNGTAGADSIGGTVMDDRINGLAENDELLGGLGRDKVYGGDGNDIIRYAAVDELMTGEVVDGGTGANDILVLEGGDSSNYNFSKVTVTGVEFLQFEGGGSATFQVSQTGSGALSTFIGNLMAQSIAVQGVTVDGTAFTYQDWDDTTDIIYLQANATLDSTLTGGGMAERLVGMQGNDTLSAGGGNDRLTGGAGLDAMSGGDGNDRFSYAKVLEIADGESLDGGTGSDTIEIVGGSGFEFWRTDITSVERLSVSMFGGDVVFDGAQIGGQAGRINTISSAQPGVEVTVRGPVVNLSGLAFETWSAFATMHLAGQADAVNSLIGSVKSDIIDGGELNDTLNGGKGIDYLTGGLGKDVMTGGNQTDYFIFHDIAESLAGAARDRIADFSVNNDLIDLSAIDAIEGGSDDAFAFIGTDAFSGAGQLRYEVLATNNTLVEADLDGNGVADFQIILTGGLTLSGDDFTL